MAAKFDLVPHALLEDLKTKKTMPTDFRDGHAFPRRGREAVGGFLWLGRVIDKARATANRTQDGYNYPCPMDRAMMRHWGVSPKEFRRNLLSNPDLTRPGP